MVFGNSQVHLCIAYHREGGLCGDFGFAVSFLSQVFEVEFLLIDCSGGQECGIDPFIEPGRSEVAGVAYIAASLYLMAVPLVDAKADGYVASNLFIILQDISPGDFLIAGSRPATVQAQCLGQ